MPWLRLGDGNDILRLTPARCFVAIPADANLKRALEQLNENEAAVAEAINEARAAVSYTHLTLPTN